MIVWISWEPFPFVLSFQNKTNHHKWPCKEYVKDGNFVSYKRMFSYFNFMLLKFEAIIARCFWKPFIHSFYSISINKEIIVTRYTIIRFNFKEFYRKLKQKFCFSFKCKLFVIIILFHISLRNRYVTRKKSCLIKIGETKYIWYVLSIRESYHSNSHQKTSMLFVY